ncbi:MAG: bifunctional folylpolyglutamate synthase/dihydrofolate synthase [Candidatus Omnitrophica bacterium]|nr:bifunctional folylpolyglutamate synthase/dihydrofolate synthase [Candidatus Omnitrophota bacterium]
MTYKEALQYLNSFVNYERVLSFDYKESFKLDRMRRLVALLGDPHKGLRCIHITGTKGKGSTSAMAASILKEAGFKVGLYTSPHLVSFRERIRINDELIGEEELSGTLRALRPVVDSIDKDSDDYPTFFEIYTALAFFYFRQRKVDFCVLEVGMGGRLDATNVIEAPLCCGITPISLEHTQILGSSLREIAREKAGIIKDGSVCVSAPGDNAAAEVIRQAAAEKNNRYFEVGRDIQFSKKADQAFSIRGIFEKYPDLEVGLLGDHQFINAAAAVGLIESLRFYDIIVKADAIRGGLRNVKWPGRLQILQKRPYIVLDGAQNKASARILKEAIRRYFKYGRLILVLGISRDKDIKGICEELAPLSDKIILTRADNPRAEEPPNMVKFVGGNAVIATGVEEAMAAALNIASPDDLILVTGSFFVLGEVLSMEGARV